MKRGLHPNVCPSEVVVGVCGVARPGYSDRYRTSCLEGGQENVRLSATLHHDTLNLAWFPVVQSVNSDDQVGAAEALAQLRY